MQSITSRHWHCFPSYHHIPLIPSGIWFIIWLSRQTVARHDIISLLACGAVCLDNRPLSVSEFIMPETFVCDNCGKEFSTSPSRRTTTKVFCSMKCYTKQYRTSRIKERVAYICDYCGTVFYRLASQMIGKSNTFCSRPCRYNYRHSGEWTPPNKISNEKALSDFMKLSS